jgi:hypothetical protein
VELFRGPAEVQRLRDGEEVAGLAYLNHQSLRISIRDEIRPSVYDSSLVHCAV